MYLVFWGDDRLAIKNAVDDYLISHDIPSQQITYLEAGEYQSGSISSLVGAGSLFGGREVIVLDTPSENVDFKSEVKTQLPDLAESANLFIIIETKLLAEDKKTYSKWAQKITEFKKPSEAKFNPFKLAEALANKDKKSLWTLLQEAKLAGLREEELVGILWWQLKTIRLASVTSSAQEAGMKDYPYNKAKQALRNIPIKRADQLSKSLLKVYHDGHAGLREMDLGLERWVLEI
jgi:DNA polymerase III delta subunit